MSFLIQMIKMKRKKHKAQKYVIKRKFIFKDYENSLKVHQLETEMYHLRHHIQADGPKKIIKI